MRATLKFKKPIDKFEFDVDENDLIAIGYEKVVRCKDCKYFVEDRACICKDGGMFEPNIDDYCSYGEKREVEG